MSTQDDLRKRSTEVSIRELAMLCTLRGIGATLTACQVLPSHVENPAQGKLFKHIKIPLINHGLALFSKQAKKVYRLTQALTGRLLTANADTILNHNRERALSGLDGRGRRKGVFEKMETRRRAVPDRHTPAREQQ